jgi:hypothetical protein
MVESMRGSAVCFSLVERLKEVLQIALRRPQPHNDDGVDAAAGTGATAARRGAMLGGSAITAIARNGEESAGHSSAGSGGSSGSPQRDPATARGLSISHGPLLVSMKSTFQAHVCRVGSVDDVRSVLQQLYQDPRIQRATHNMWAFRIATGGGGGPTGAPLRVTADNDDDGEDAAGGRLAHLLQAMQASDVLVVVSRWFGGVLMGPVRFKVICDVARQHIEAQPWFKGRQAAPTAKK